MTLEARERGIVEGVALGLNDTQIAVRVTTTKFMVKKQLKTIFDKTGMNGRLELALWFMSRNLCFGCERKCGQVLICLLAFCSLAAAVPVVQSKQCQDWSNWYTSYPCAFDAPTTAGNSIIVMALDGSAGAITVTDNASHTYTTDLNYSFGQRVIMASASGVSAAQTITVSATSSHWQVIIMEVQGTATKDVSATHDNGYNSNGTGGGPYPFTSGNVTTTQANDLLVGWTEQMYSSAPNFTFTDASPWLLVQQEPIGGSRIAARNVTSIGTYAYTGTFSSSPAGLEYETYSGIVAYKVTAPAAAPVVNFSDLTWGPRTGWEGSSTKGAAVSIWGLNFGASGSVLACGQTLLSSDSTKVAEWNATTNPTVPRGMGRITFWLNSSMSATCSEGIAVASGWQTSGTIPFTIAAGNIYFIATDGNDTYNGLYATRTGHSGSDGPFRNQSKFNPANGLGDNQYIVYIRTGTYTAVDPYYAGASALIELYGPFGSSTHQKALIGYPTEVATLDPRNVTNGAIYPCNYTGGPTACTQLNYFTWAKLNFNGQNTTYPEDAFDSYGQYTRFIGNNVVNFRPTSQLQSGLVFIGASQYAWIEGNYFYNNGYDSYAHSIYIKSQTGYPVSTTLETVHDVDVGWNEISAPYSNDAHGGAIFLSREGAMPAGSNTNHIFIHHNYFHDGTEGDFVYIGDAGSIIDYVYIYDNVFSGGSSTSGTSGGNYLTAVNGHLFIYNNTFYQVAAPGSSASNTCIYQAQNGGGPITQTANNICYGLSNQTMYLAEGGGSWTSTTDMFYNPAGSATWSGTITRTNSIVNQNPLFVNSIINGDYHLQSSSPARGVGTNLYATLAALGTTAQGLNVDYAGLPYPSAGAWDVGAFAFSAAPQAPTYSISGTVSGAAGCLAPTITLSGAGSGTTTANPNYTFSGLAANSGPYTVTATSTPTCSYSAALTNINIASADQTGKNFTATALTPPVPTCTPAGGSWKSAKMVQCTNASPGATMCWNMGSAPSTNGAGTCSSGNTYAGTFLVSTSGTLYVTGTQAGNTDNTRTYSFPSLGGWSGGWVMNLPEAGTLKWGGLATNPACAPPNYCGSTSMATAVQPSPPNVGKTTGAGTIFYDPVYGTKGVRLTDANFDPSMAGNQNNSYSTSQGGSADDLASNTGDFLTVVVGAGGRHYIVGFNKDTLALSRPYQDDPAFSAYGGWATGDTLDFSLADPCKVYATGSAGSPAAIKSFTFGSDVVRWANPCSPSITGPPTATTVNLIEDSPAGCVGAACSCLPSDFGAVTWISSGGGSLNDAILARAFTSAAYHYGSGTGQGYGYYTVLYSPTKGCMSYNTLTGDIKADVGWAGGAGLTCTATQCTGTATDETGNPLSARFTLHNVKMNKSGTAVSLVLTTQTTGTNCIGWGLNPWLWVPGTTTVYCSEGSDAAHYSGHWALGSKGMINDPGSPLYQKWYRLEPAAGPAGTAVSVNNVPTNPACTVSAGSHESWQSADPNDTWPFMAVRTGSGLPPFDAPECAWVNELDMYDMNGDRQVHRLAFTFLTGYNTMFNVANGISVLSPSGRFASTGSDWLNSTRNAAGTSACNGMTSPSSTCIPNGPAWKTGKAYPLNYIINPTVNNAGNFSYHATVSGTSGATQPTWSTSCVAVGSTCSDGTVTWTNIGVPTGVNAVGSDAFLWDLQSAH